MTKKSSLDILEFHKLLRILSDFANSDASEDSVMDIRPLENKDDIQKRFSQINEIRRMSDDGDRIQLSAFSDISPLFEKVRPEGAFLEALELSYFIPVLSIAFAISEQMQEKDNLHNLKKLTDLLTGLPDILAVLKKSVDSEGNILDSASFLLADLRSQIRKLENRIRKKLEEIVRDERLSILLQDDFITVRSGRWVIPVRMDSKGMVPGVVHDVSKSGETAFIEPLSIINLANELENLVAEQKAEEIRILRNICSLIRSSLDDIEGEFQTIVYLDVLNCIAQFADVLNMETPQINETETIQLYQARHPLLQLALKKTGQKLVPLDVHLGGEQTVMVITGANAGGKTIAIKTIGLLLLMALSGMPVPADSSSNFPYVKDILVDIGDEQSIESSLSTFSAHISKISEILENIHSRSLILLDELGTGTDPDEGSALACAILQEMKKSGALVFATTHLAEIKGFVHRSAGMVNASMEFDTETLTPFYRLRVGEPGQSHALEIARRYGLPGKIIDTASGMLGRLKVEFDSLIADLNTKRLHYENSLKELQKSKEAAEERERLLHKMLADMKEKQNDILSSAYQEASDIISSTKRQMHTLLDEIKKKERKEKQKVIKQVETKQEEIEEKLKAYTADDQAVPPLETIRKGDTVYVKSLGDNAFVVEISLKNSRLKVLARNKEIEVPLSDIRFQKRDILQTEVSGTSVRDESPTVALKLNLIGMRVDEASSKLERFLNDASLSELRELTVVHGVGKGILMRAVHEHLDNHPLVQSYRKGTTGEGGNGVTIITMK